MEKTVGNHSDKQAKKRSVTVKGKMITIQCDSQTVVTRELEYDDWDNWPNELEGKKRPPKPKTHLEQKLEEGEEQAKKDAEEMEALEESEAA